MNNALAQAISVNVAAYYGEIADDNNLSGKYSQALAAYQKALQFNEDPDIYTALADLYSNKLKNKVQAKFYYKKAVAALQKQIQTMRTPMDYYTLAALYDVQLKDTANAVKYYKKFLASKPRAKQQQYITYTQSRINQLTVAN
jgi:tetratricopeptide (TPR) repeat protein